MKKKKIIHFLGYMFMSPAAEDVQGFPRPFKAIKAYPNLFNGFWENFFIFIAAPTTSTVPERKVNVP
jgi:hypothetical protein